MEHFTRDELKQDLAANLAEILTRLRHLFGPGAAEQLMPGVKTNAFSVLPEGLSVDGLPVTYKFLKLYDYVVEHEWDRFGGHHHADDLYLDVSCFMEWLQSISEHFVNNAATERCQYLVDVARARLKLDEAIGAYLSQEELTLEDVALLANLNIASVRNAASRGEFLTDEVNGERQVSDAESLRAWLQARRNFRPTRVYDSIDDMDPQRFDSLDGFTQFLLERMLELGVSKADFRERLGWDANRFRGVQPLRRGDLESFDVSEWKKIAGLLQVEKRWLVARAMSLFPYEVDYSFQERVLWELWDKARSSRDRDAVLVPVAGDGTLFLPELRRRKGYQIGRKGSERYLGDYFAALRELRGMEPPYWRRPSESTGTYGIVKGVSWKPVSKSSLMKSIEHSDEEVPQ